MSEIRISVVLVIEDPENEMKDISDELHIIDVNSILEDAVTGIHIEASESK